jgi:hypothetical protein
VRQPHQPAVAPDEARGVDREGGRLDAADLDIGAALARQLEALDDDRGIADEVHYHVGPAPTHEAPHLLDPRLGGRERGGVVHRVGAATRFFTRLASKLISIIGWGLLIGALAWEFTRQLF